MDLGRAKVKVLLSWLKNSVICLSRGHDIPENWLMREMGALFHGGICRRCKRLKVGEFFCNEWNDAETEKQDGVISLRGTNSFLLQGNWAILGDIETLRELSDELRGKSKVGCSSDGPETSDQFSTTFED